MKGELHHAEHPRHTHLRWAAFYVVASIALVVGFVVIANRIRTYSVPTGNLILSIPYKKYIVGESIAFAITNHYNSTVYIENDCPGEPLAVYRKTGDDWKRLHDQSQPESCKNKERQIAIAPGGVRSSNFDSWPNLFKEPGMYRVVAYVGYFNTAPYQDFEVISKPEKRVVAQAPSVAPTPTYTNTSPTRTTVSNQGQTVAAPTTPAIQYAEKTIATSAGTVSVKYSSTSFTILAVVPNAGCSFEGNGVGFTGTNSETTFKCPDGETQLQLRLVGGVLRQRVED